MTSKTTPTLQVVVNPLLERKSPVSRQMFASLKQLEADYIRYVPWHPYPRLAVAELEPPSGSWLCTQLQLEEPSGWNASLSCTLGVVNKVHFASYGTPRGTCGNFTMGKCNAANTTAFVEKMCVGKKSCTFPVNEETLGDPCVGTAKTFAVQVTCSVPQNHTYWDFSLLDPMMEDFMAATRNHSVVINFSTIPAWIYKTPSRVPYPDNPDRESVYTQGVNLVDPSGSQLGDYYGRLVSWYTKGGFKDEYGVEHKSGHEYIIPYWECLNEVEHEHQNTPESYTARYDEMVNGIRRVADPNHKIAFVGLALPYHSTEKLAFASYFLNKSNHQPGIPLDFISYHFYARPTNRTDPSAYESVFAQADTFFTEVAGMEEIRKALSPETRTTIDEIGVILPDDNDVHAPMFPPIYWNAAGAMYAYIYGKLSLQGIDVLGESQLVGNPALPHLDLEPQFPSVTLLNWTTGYGTARYWVLHMLIHNFQPGDEIVQTDVSFSGAGRNPFCGSVINLEALALECTTPGAVISKIDFASYGTSSGECLHYDVGSCNAANSTAIVEKYCVGKSSCTVPATTPVFGDPCRFTVKHLVVQAECSKGGGMQRNDTGGLYAQGFVDGKTRSRKLLLVNKGNSKVTVNVSGAKGGSFVFVDETTTGQTDEVVESIDSDNIELLPFATGVVYYPSDAR